MWLHFCWEPLILGVEAYDTCNNPPSVTNMAHKRTHYMVRVGWLIPMEGQIDTSSTAYPWCWLRWAWLLEVSSFQPLLDYYKWLKKVLLVPFVITFTALLCRVITPSRKLQRCHSTSLASQPLLWRSIWLCLTRPGFLRSFHKQTTKTWAS